MRFTAVDAWTPCLITSGCLFLAACGSSSHGPGAGGGAQAAGTAGGPSGVGGEDDANPANGGSDAGANGGASSGGAGGASSGGASSGGASSGGASSGGENSAGGSSGTGGAAHTGGSGGGGSGGRAEAGSGDMGVSGGVAGSGDGGASGASGAAGNPSAGSCDPLSCPDLGTCTVTDLADGCERTCAFDQPYSVVSDADVARLAALGCTIIDGSVDVIRGDTDSLLGLESIREITGSLTIDGAKLLDLNGLDGLQTVGTLTVQRLDIQSVVLPALSHVDQLTVTSLTMLQTLHLPSLVTADTGVMITACSPVTSIDLDALATVGQELDISLNSELLTLNGMPALTSAPSLYMAINPKLPQCQVDAIAARLGSATDCTCQGNDASGTCN